MEKRKHMLWYSEAENDLEMANILLKTEHFNGAVFHCQQAGEKALKAFLYYLNEQPWGHSLHNLLGDIEKYIGVVAKDLRNAARELDRHYTTARYPDGLPDLTPKDAYDEIIAEKMIDNTQLILQFVEQKINEKSTQNANNEDNPSENGEKPK